MIKKVADLKSLKLITVGIDKFGIFKKWFLVGIAISILNVFAGLVFGIALAVEKEHRKEGLIIVAFAIVWSIVVYFVVLPWFINLGVVPVFKRGL